MASSTLSGQRNIIGQWGAEPYQLPNFTGRMGIMFVVFNNSVAIACFEEQAGAVAYWREHGGTIILYPDLKSGDVYIRA